MDIDDVFEPVLKRPREPIDEAIEQLKFILGCIAAVIFVAFVVLPVFGGAVPNGNFLPNFFSWGDIFYGFQPHFFAFMGTAFAIALSVVGAGW